jgi:hypothetical protein
MRAYSTLTGLSGVSSRDLVALTSRQSDVKSRSLRQYETYQRQPLRIQPMSLGRTSLTRLVHVLQMWSESARLEDEVVE